jgi:hypothetical protein
MYFHSKQFSYSKYLVSYIVRYLETHTETYMGLRVKYLLFLSTNNRKWNMTANFIETLQRQTS